jgi:hypothetical protein
MTSRTRRRTEGTESVHGEFDPRVRTEQGSLRALRFLQPSLLRVLGMITE